MRLRPCVMVRPSLRPKEGRWFFPELIELFSPLPSSFSFGPNLDRNRPEKGRKTSAVWGGGGREEEKIASCSKLFLKPSAPPPHPPH